MNILRNMSWVVGIFLLASCTPPGGSSTNSGDLGVSPSPVVRSGVAVGQAAQVKPSSAPTTVSVDFGRMDVGSPFPPPLQHDGSGHAMDKMFPRTIVIRTNDTVKFNTFGVHEIALYEPGTQPEDIDTSKLEAPKGGCPPEIPYIDDPHNRIAVLADAQCEGGPTEVQYTFTKPGKYLVICNFLVHFVDSNMYGWVEVKDN